MNHTTQQGSASGVNRRQFIDRVCAAGAAGIAAGSAALAGQQPQQSAAQLPRQPSSPPASPPASPGRQDADRAASELKYPLPAKDGRGEAFPSHDPALVQEIVGASHANLARVTELVQRQPALARASWDWGFGDWETALGAAAHTGQRAIAELLLAHGAPPTLFSAAMLGQLDVVKAIVAATPGIERQPGPHGIPLLAHARAGGEPAAAVLKYLEGLGMPARPAAAPLDSADRTAIAGRYVFGPAPRDVFIVDEERGAVGIRREGATRRFLRHLGALEFTPAGADAVRIHFVRDAAGGAAAAIAQLTVSGVDASDAKALVTARRGTGSA